ncbi:hypothetical protein JRO89_XS06G0053800 [Xanthoceras sorbifolium]|uniref:Uncharacterized protein n=1 Tax=Xanthoceras sorbifolium TaxID=99658 RepID=A0ABQ8HWR3_9ROSI|nr:hypothetical protein JRO89_XS06G0053800 [Xanthoceras sorbifolium]
MSGILNINSPFLSSNEIRPLCHPNFKTCSLYSTNPLVYYTNNRSSSIQPPRFCRPAKATTAPMEAEQSGTTTTSSSSNPPMNLLFVEMGVGYDQHGQDVTAAAMRACRDAISSNSIPAFRRDLKDWICKRTYSVEFMSYGYLFSDAIEAFCCKTLITLENFNGRSIPGVSFEQMKLLIKLGVPHSLHPLLDIEKVKSVFPYGKILNVEVVDGGLICSSGVHVEEMGDKNDDCYIVNAAVYVGY